MGALAGLVSDDMSSYHDLFVAMQQGAAFGMQVDITQFFWRGAYNLFFSRSKP